MLTYFVYYLLGAIQLAMLARAILSWIAPDLEGTAISFLYMVTEPVIVIFRFLLDRMGIKQQGMLDLAFFSAVIFLSLFHTLIGALL